MPRRLLAVVAAIAAAVVVAAGDPLGGDDVYGGVPHVAAWGQRLSTHVLHNPGFTIGYSEWRRQPLWVAYRAAAARGRRLGPRPPHFEADARVWRKVSSDDYTHSHYDRGHLAPNFLIGKLYGPQAQRATFLMSNISPQKKRLNVLVWQRLEEAEADHIAPAAGELWVVTGPLFGEHPDVIGPGIAVPEAFYRIWLHVTPAGAPRALAFVVPQQVCGTEPLSQYLARVDDIEQRAGLDFFHELADEQEQPLEAARSAAGWGLERFDRSAPRYADKFGRLQC
jgi:endonuclease G